MGFFSKLFGRRRESRPDIFFGGNGKYDVPVWGTSHTQQSLARLALKHEASGRRNYRSFLAHLVCDTSNAENPRAVRVTLEGTAFGYLPPDITDEYLATLERMGRSGEAACCRAKIVGGHVVADDEDNLTGPETQLNWGIRLNLARPFKVGKALAD